MITSKQNPHIQRVRKLVEKTSEREEAGAYVVEGVRLVEEVLQRGIPCETVFFDDSLTERGKKVVSGLSEQGVQTVEVSSSVLSALADTNTPQGILAILPIPSPAVPEDPNFLLVLDTIRDPGNLGSILRTAAAAGVQAVFLSPGCVDVYSPKVVRAGMGAHFVIPIIRAKNWDDLAAYLWIDKTSQQLTVIQSSPNSQLSIWDADFRSPLAIMVSNEAQGTSLEAARIANLDVTIPMPGGFESLNAAIAAGILLFEVIRQRQI